VEKIDLAREDVFKKLEETQYPLNDHWLNWEPDSHWQLPRLPKNWAEIAG